MQRLTKEDYLDEYPGLGETVGKLKQSGDPRLAARVTRDEWWDVEYLMWDGDRWYGCVQNHRLNCGSGWETTDVGEYSEDQVYGALAKVRRGRYGLNLVPVEDTPLGEVSG